MVRDQARFLLSLGFIDTNTSVRFGFDMGIKMKTPIDEVDKFLYKAFEILKNEISRCLTKLGEECVAKIKDRSGSESWFDRTGNLRSSIGYGVYDYGVKVLQSAFHSILQGSEGSEEGQKMLSQLGDEYSDCFALVVVAGMNYADHVESLDNKDVLASTELWAKDVIESRLERAKKVAIEKIDKLVA